MLSGIAVAIVSLIFTVIGIPRFIMYFHKKKIGGQPTLEDVKQHASKAGTPTMGGFVFVIVALFVSLIAAFVIGQITAQFIIAWWVLASYAVIGFMDDFLKIFKKKNQGLTAAQKMLGQIGIGLVSYLIYTSASHVKQLAPLGGLNGQTVSAFPIHQMKINHILLFGRDFDIGILFLVFVIIWLVGWSNAVNLTDGLDGLASISVSISLIAYAIIAVVQEQYDVFLIILAVIGGLIGFFFFNYKPAKIFMGDVGSLALGGFLAIISILLRAEWTLLLIGFVYICETLSVMLQVGYFKISHGKRIFAMAPLHHHFELGGFSGKGKKWSEWKIDYFFWTVTAVMSIIALIIFL